MDRRTFVKSSLITGSVLGPFSLKTSSMEDRSKQQWYELRTYIFSNDTQRQLTETYLQQAYLPALNRAGITSIGVFSESQPQAIARTFLLIPLDSIQTFVTIQEKLARDATYLKA